jgi:60S ribosome subunit biogenesis protein NIP7
LIPYREPTRQELTVLRRTFNHWGIFDYVLDKEVLLKEKQFRGYKIREVYISTRENFVIISKRMSLSHSGMLIGHLRRRSFLPSMAGADLIAREGVNFPFAMVNQTAEALVLYGRDVMQSSIVNYGNLGRNNAILIILNENRIAIGVGMTIVPIGKNIYHDDKRIVIKTIADAGQYLRNENRKDS